MTKAAKPRAEAGSDAPLTTRESLIRSATRLWYERGYERVSIQEIVDAAGVTKGAFYHHFRGKDELLMLIHDQFIEDEIAAVRRVIDKGLSPSETLRGIFVELLDSVAKYREQVTVFFREMRSLSCESFAKIEPRRALLGELTLSVLRDGISSGEFRPVKDLQLAMFAINGMCVWAYEWFDSDGPFSAREVGEMYADMVLDGLRTAPDTLQSMAGARVPPET